MTLQDSVGSFLEQRGYRALYSVDSSVHARTNDVLIRLKDTTPDAVIEEIAAVFPNMPLRIERTASRWAAF